MSSSGPQHTATPVQKAFFREFGNPDDSDEEQVASTCVTQPEQSAAEQSGPLPKRNSVADSVAEIPSDSADSARNSVADSARNSVADSAEIPLQKFRRRFTRNSFAEIQSKIPLCTQVFSPFHYDGGCSCKDEYLSRLVHTFNVSEQTKTSLQLSGILFPELLELSSEDLVQLLGISRIDAWRLSRLTHLRKGPLPTCDYRRSSSLVRMLHLLLAVCLLRNTRTP